MITCRIFPSRTHIFSSESNSLIPRSSRPLPEELTPHFLPLLNSLKAQRTPMSDSSGLLALQAISVPTISQVVLCSSSIISGILAEVKVTLLLDCEYQYRQRRNVLPSLWEFLLWEAEVGSLSDFQGDCRCWSIRKSLLFRAFSRYDRVRMRLRQSLCSWSSFAMPKHETFGQFLDRLSLGSSVLGRRMLGCIFYLFENSIDFSAFIFKFQRESNWDSIINDQQTISGKYSFAFSLLGMWMISTFYFFLKRTSFLSLE